MRYFKKKALSLVIASVLTATVSFASEQFKDKLSYIEFKEVSGNNVDLVLKTDKMLDIGVTPRKMDPETYVIMLPEVDGAGVPTPDISKVSGYIKNISVRTLPYSGSSKGYTRITVKTFGRTNLTSSNQVYNPDEIKNDTQQQNNLSYNTPQDKTTNIKKVENTPYKDIRSNQQYETKPAKTDSVTKKSAPQQTATSSANIPENTDNLNNETDKNETGLQTNPDSINAPAATTASVPKSAPVEHDNSQPFLFLLGVVGIIIITLFIILKGNDVMGNVIGEKLNIDVDDETKKKENPKNKESKNKIAATIKKLDAAYSNTSYLNNHNPYTPSADTESSEKEDEPLNIVDLDELFKEQTSADTNNEDEDSALDDFLSGFSFDDTELQTPNTDTVTEELFDEETFEKIVSSKIKFSKEDIKCFRELMRSEVNMEALKELGQHLVTNPIAPVNKKVRGMLEALVTDYSISRNIIFTKEDIDILKKLMSVEIDRSFIEDLRTNPYKTKQMEKSITSHKPQTRKPSELLTLNVKGMLPNLSEELQKRGNKPIAYELKPETIYFSEGWEYTKLHVTDLPDLQKELQTAEIGYNETKEENPEFEDADYTSVVQTVSVADSLPDLSDALENPEKYMDIAPKKAVADENALLNSLQNIKFKAFDEGKEFEVLNNAEDFADIDSQNTENATDNENVNVDEILNEISYEVSPPDDITTHEQDDKVFDELFADKEDNTESTEITPTNINNDFKENKQPALHINKNKKSETKTPNKRTSKPQRIFDEELRQKIEAARAERIMRREELAKQEKARELRHKTHEAIIKSEFVKCKLNGETYDILSSVNLTERSGCYFAKCEKGYAVLCYEGNDIRLLKEYTETKSEKIQARLSESLPDNIQRFLIRIGTNKFIVDEKNDNISFVMDLC